MANYNIEWQSKGLEGIPGKENIDLPQKTLNSSSTSLTLTGKGVTNYGEIQQENFIRLMENFASALPPPNATIGQLWWNPAETILYLRIDPAVVGELHPRYYPESPAAWVQIWPSRNVYASLEQYNAMALTINKIIGIPSQETGAAEAADNQWGWGQTDLVPEYDNVNTLKAGFDPLIYPGTFDNNSWVILLARLRKALRFVNMLETDASPVGFIDDGRPAPPNGNALANTYNDFGGSIPGGLGNLPNYTAGWDETGAVQLSLYYAATLAAISNLISNRFPNLAGPPNQAGSVEILNTTYSTPWNSTIGHTIDVVFTSELAAQAYFNAGGEIRFRPTLTPNGSDFLSVSWQQFLSTEIDQLAFDRKGIKRFGIYKNAPYSAYSFGFYDLTSTHEIIYAEDRDDPSFASHYNITDGGFAISAKKIPNGIQFIVYFAEGVDGVEQVDGVLASVIKAYHPSTRNLDTPGVEIPLATSTAIASATYVAPVAPPPPPPVLIAPVANFTLTPNPAAGNPASVTLIDTSLNSPATIEWDFTNDGSYDLTQPGGSSTVQSYAPGSYVVKMRATNSAGSSEITKSLTVNASVVTPVADFTISPNPALAYPSPATVTLTDTSTNSPTLIEWDFTNDGTYDASGLSGDVQLEDYAVGSYTIKLRATNSAGSHIVTKTLNVNPQYTLLADTSTDDVTQGLTYNNTWSPDAPIIATMNTSIWPGTASFSLVSGTLPPGMSLTFDNTLGARLVLFGTPTSAGSYAFSVQVTEPSAYNSPITVSKTVTVQVASQPGTLWSWGYNGIGELGLGNTTSSTYPIQVGILTDWTQVSGGHDHSLAVKTDGTLWSWGYNGSGHLGLGDTTPRSSPVQVGSLTNWKEVSGGSHHSLAVKTDGTLWAWGQNYYGELGLGDITDRSSPVQVGTLTDWQQVSAGEHHSLAVKTDGTLWSWGYNVSGQLGLGDITHRSSPVQVGSLTNWQQVSGGEGHSLAVKTDGTLWSWGHNGYGQLGLGDTTDRSSPVQVGSLTDWKEVSGGQYYSFAVKTDGTLWSWGYNGYGELGLGDTTPRSSPVQVGSLTNWQQVSGGEGHSLAVKTDGTLWSWGYNMSGELGVGDTTHRSSPVQVGSLTNWKQISGGQYYTLALK